MKISLIKALKSPFEKQFLIPCIIWAIMTTWAYTYIQITKDLSFMNNLTIHCLMLAPYIIGLVIMIGYFSSFAHNAVLGHKNLFNMSARPLFKNGIKTLLFTLCSYLIVFSSAILAVIGLTYLPTGINLFTFIFIQAFTFLYLLTAWTKFTDTFCMTEPLKVVSMAQLLGKNWPAYLKIALYMIIAVLILAFPIGLIKQSLLLLAYQSSWIAYFGIFITSFLYLYPTFVVLHIMAQGYAGIKNNTLTCAVKQNIENQPVITTKPHIVQKKKTPKVISKKKAPIKKQTITTKTVQKNGAKKNTKTAKKVK